MLGLRGSDALVRQLIKALRWWRFNPLNCAHVPTQERCARRLVKLHVQQGHIDKAIATFHLHVATWIAGLRVMLFAAEMLGHLCAQRGFQHRLGQLHEQAVRARQRQPLLLLLLLLMRDQPGRVL